MYSEWLEEVLEVSDNGKYWTFDPLSSQEIIPTLVVGNKIDLLEQYEIDEEYGSTICLSALEMRELEQHNSHNLKQFEMFFRRCFETKYAERYIVN